MEAISIYASRGVSFSEIICHCSTVRFLLSQKLLKPLGAVFQDIGDAAAYDPAWARWSRGERRERSIPWVVLLRPQRLGSHHQAGTWAPLCRDISQNYINCNQSLWEHYYASKQSATTTTRRRRNYAFYDFYNYWPHGALFSLLPFMKTISGSFQCDKQKEESVWLCVAFED